MEGAVVYMLTFQVQSLTDEQEDAVFEVLDAQPMHIDGVHLVALAIEGTSLTAACNDAIDTINALGLGVVRLYEDLVSRPQIADRVGVSTQAVGAWTRGNRHTATPFPEAFSANAGGVWVWGEVVQWLKMVDKETDGFEHPVREDYWRINAGLANGLQRSNPFSQPVVIPSAMERHVATTIHVSFSKFDIAGLYGRGIRYVSVDRHERDASWAGDLFADIQYDVDRGKLSR